MGGKKKRGGFFFKWMKSELPDREEKSSPVILLAVHNSPSSNQHKSTSNSSSTLPCGKHFDNIDTTSDRPKHIFTQINERFRKTLSLDSRNQNSLSCQNDYRPKSMVTTSNLNSNCCSSNLPNTSKLSNKTTKKKGFRPKSFFSLETFLDSKRSDTSSADDFSSSKYCKFYLDSSAECSPVLNGKVTPDLLDISHSDAPTQVSEEVRCKKRLDKLENHFNKIQKLKNSKQSLTESFNCQRINCSNEEQFYSEPIYEGSITSQSTLIIDANTETLDSRKGVNNRFERSVSPIECEINYQGDKTLQVLDSHDISNPNSNVSNYNKSIAYFHPNDYENSHSYMPNCSGFDLKDCSNVLRNACYGNCSSSLGKSRSGDICCKERTPSSAYEIRITEDDILINEKTKNLVVKTMDKSVDSIGSCSLDVDAENTDFSDTTSGSLNILTPSSTNSQFRDFTAKFHERAISGLRQDLRECPLTEENLISRNSDFLHPSNNSSQPKKPSYLHLACSVNGYSNLTTYDSTLRQKLSRSREQSPARLGNISSFMLRNYPDETMAQKLNVNPSNTVSNTNASYFKTSFSETSISSQNVITYLKTNGKNVTSETHTSKSYNVISNGAGAESPSKSFIQQRVERLYGPGALAQGFFHQKKQTNSESDSKVSNGKFIKSPQSHVSKTEHIIYKNTQNGTTTENIYLNSENNIDEESETVLPVLRHLRAEFRAQLPLLSPKRSPLGKISDNTTNIVTNLEASKRDAINSRLEGNDVVDRSVDFSYKNGTTSHPESKPVVTIIPIVKSESSVKTNLSSNGDIIPKTGVSSDNNVIKIDDVHRPDDHKSDLAKIVKEKQEESYENIPVIKPLSNDDISLVPITIENNLNNKSKNENETKITHNEDESKVGCVEDGHYFLALCRAEMERLEQLAVSAEKELESIQDLPDVTEEIRGFLRVAAGKARLLASEKMKQFEGLCFKNLNGQPDSKFPTTIGDLRGFWDMVYLQVEDIGVLFEQVKEMKKSNWKEIPTVKRAVEAPSKSSVSRNVLAKKSVKNQNETSSKTSELSKKRNEQRKALIEAKRRAAKLQANDSVEIFAHPPPSDLEKS